MQTLNVEVPFIRSPLLKPGDWKFNYNSSRCICSKQNKEYISVRNNFDLGVCSSNESTIFAYIDAVIAGL